MDSDVVVEEAATQLDRALERLAAGGCEVDPEAPVARFGSAM